MLRPAARRVPLGHLSRLAGREPRSFLPRRLAADFSWSSRPACHHTAGSSCVGSRDRWVPLSRLGRQHQRRLNFQPRGLAAVPSSAAEVVVDSRPPQALRDAADPNALLNLCSDDVVDMAGVLINTPSISGFEQAMAQCLYRFLRGQGWEVVLQPVGPQRGLEGGEERFNVFAHQPGAPNPELIFNTHMDTVPPYFPATLDRGTGVLRGRGACDTKSLMAAQMLAAQALVAAGHQSSVGLLFVVSEETDHTGMQVANSLNLSPRWMIVGEPTEKKVIRAQKGILKVLHELLGEQWPSGPLGDTHLNIGTLTGGEAANVVAPSASADLLFRLVDDPQPTLERVSEIASRFGGSVELIAVNPPVPMEYVHDAIKGYDFDTVAFNTDIPYFDFSQGDGPPGKAVLYGHGSITDAHTLREHILVDDLRQLVSCYGELANQLLYQ